MICPKYKEARQILNGSSSRHQAVEEENTAAIYKCFHKIDLNNKL